ncbi:MAG TPA: ABC transporter permease [Conexibacter sp.]|nr:ABC transporter permease [Conexibacter sp.]
MEESSDRHGSLTQERPAPSARSPLSSLTRSPAIGIVIATAILFAISPLLAADSLDRTSLLTMLPFAAVLAIAALGQTLVIQQGGIDLSVAGSISLASVIVTVHADGDDGRILSALLLVLLAALAVGLLNGALVSFLGIPPIVATLGVNSLLLGVVQQISGGSTGAAPDGLTDVALDRTLGIPNTVLIALPLIVAVYLVVKKTVIGRRFEAVGVSPRGARASGIAVSRHRFAAYVAASLAYALAGVLLAGYVKTPGISGGDAYLLQSVAAVVLGGTALTGGRGNVVASALGALFLSQLNQLVLSMGAPTAVQYLISGAIIAAGVGLRRVPLRRRRPAATRPDADAAGPTPAVAAATSTPPRRSAR